MRSHVAIARKSSAPKNYTTAVLGPISDLRLSINGIEPIVNEGLWKVKRVQYFLSQNKWKSSQLRIMKDERADSY